VVTSKYAVRQHGLAMAWPWPWQLRSAGDIPQAIHQRAASHQLSDLPGSLSWGRVRPVGLMLVDGWFI